QGCRTRAYMDVFTACPGETDAAPGPRCGAWCWFVSPEFFWSFLMSAIDELLTIMATLRDPERGCAWDLQQSFDTIVPYTIEEAFEVADAVAARDWPEFREELGDLLLQVVFHARMAEEQGLFDFRDVVQVLNE